MARTFVRFGVQVDDDLFDALAFHLGVPGPASQLDVARHSAVMLGVIHRQLIEDYRAGRRTFHKNQLRDES